jgi:hypothetical protein
MTQLARLLVVAAAVAACGDDGGNAKVDGAVVVDTLLIDGLPPGCNYAERSDATNDDLSDPPGTPEATSLAFRDDTVICGTFDSTHFDGDITVDVDSYTFSVPNETDALLRIRATGAEAFAEAGIVGIDLYTGSNLDQVAGKVTFYGDHGVSSIHLPAGNYRMQAFVLYTEAIAAPISYELELVIDTPALRCPELTSGGYTEMRDTNGNDNNENNMYQFTTATPTLSSNASDMPENTNFTLSPSADQRITGSAANVTADNYEDKDAYAFSTGSQPNELTVRLTWVNAANLDFYLFEANSTTEVSRSTSTSTASPEAKTFSVKPSTAYWLLIAAKGATGLPRPYSATLCTQNYAP